MDAAKKMPPDNQPTTSATPKEIIMETAGEVEVVLAATGLEMVSAGGDDGVVAGLRRLRLA